METGMVRGNLRATGNFGNERGRRNEDRFFEAMGVSSVEEVPRWVFGIRRASAKEDSRGIDAIIITDVGKLFIQIKSSEAGATKFKNSLHCRHRIIDVIVIREHYTPEDIREKAVDILTRLRQRILGILHGGIG